MEFKSEREDFECKRCGRCCMEGGPITWIGGNLTWEEKQELIKERKKHPKEKGCQMLYFKDKIAHCLVWEMFGKEKIEKGCQISPQSGELCIREENQNERRKIKNKK